MAIIPPPPPCAGRGAPTRADSTAEWLATIQSDARAHPDASRPPWEACPQGVAGGARGPRGRGRGGCRSARHRIRRRGRRKADLARRRRACPPTPGAGAVHDRGQRRSPDPHGRLGASAGARRWRLRLRPPVQGDQALRRGRRPGALPRRDAHDSGAADELPDLQHPSGAGAGSQGDRMGRMRHGLKPLSRPGPGRNRRHRRGTGPRRDRAHGLLPVGVRAAKAGDRPRPRGEDRLPRLHHGHERDPDAQSMVSEHRQPGARPRRRAPARTRRAPTP